MKRTLLILLKLTISLAVVSYLLTEVRARDPDTFTRLAAEPKNWGLLTAAWGCFVAALLFGVLRWLLLVRALAIQCTVFEAVRISAIAYVADFAALGAVGGDLLKVALLTRGQPGRGTDALASVLVDRLVGAYVVCLVTAASILVVGPADDATLVRAIGGTALLLAAGVTGVAVVLWMPAPGRWLAATIRRLPWVGTPLARLLDALQRYRSHRAALIGGGVLSLGALGANIAGFHLTTSGLPGIGPTLSEQLFIVPVSLMSGVIPLPMQTLGVLDYTVEHLYRVASAGRATPGLGLLVTMSYRLASIAVAMVGLGFYVTARAERERAVTSGPVQTT